ncbi:hypothetical protein OAZ92_00540 [Prochlorococcus sp. AH-736-E02]|nr:hypothetical protein [Prochlorococcus sp. AH-736-E02]
MIFKKKEFFLLYFLILLQSCSGGRIGNFLESSFDDSEKIQIQESKKINERNYEKTKKLENKNDQDSEKIQIQESKKTNERNYEKTKKLGNKNNQDSVKIKKQRNKKIKNSSKINKSDLQSYKIIFILKDVDPKDPTQGLSTILRNSEVNFEIEKIERILDSKNKSMNKN